MTSLYLFTLLVAALAVQRLWELKISRRNEKWLLASGGQEVGKNHFIVMKFLHASWLVCMLLEVWFFQAPFLPYVSLAARAVFMFGQWLRWTAIRTLGRHWCARVIVLPEESPVCKGIYRYIRHPNYVGVALEISAFPLLHTAWRTALVFTLANLSLLFVRIGIEERALNRQNRYAAVFGKIPRFLPRRMPWGEAPK